MELNYYVVKTSRFAEKLSIQQLCDLRIYIVKIFFSMQCILLTKFDIDIIKTYPTGSLTQLVERRKYVVACEMLRCALHYRRLIHELLMAISK